MKHEHPFALREKPGQGAVKAAAETEKLSVKRQDASLPQFESSKGSSSGHSKVEPHLKKTHRWLYLLLLISWLVGSLSIWGSYQAYQTHQVPYYDNNLLIALPAMLGMGQPAHYLIEVLDSTELRPGGGFIGNYGILTLSNGSVSDAHITDTSLLDAQYRTSGHVIPYPSAYKWFHLAPDSWSLRDANLDADFPTVARYSEKNYWLEGGREPLQGVIAITPALIQHILEITGPIAVPEYHETITVNNLIDRIHYHQLAASEGSGTVPASDGHSSQRKHFTALLA
ncbi:MAG: DUF4012 domain-containing protein, partial [Ktedonobacteraceae bacterium]